jgi:hypothetical protein
MKYTIELTENQAAVIQRACEVYMRLCIGQLEHVHDVTIWGEAEPKEGHAIEANRVRAYSNALKFEMFGFNPQESWGVYQSPNRIRTAYDVIQVIRHRLAWDIRPLQDGKGWNVNYNTPLQCGDEPLPEITHE